MEQQSSVGVVDTLQHTLSAGQRHVLWACRRETCQVLDGLAAAAHACVWVNHDDRKGLSSGRSGTSIRGIQDSAWQEWS
jgi:hypothetical protein